MQTIEETVQVTEHLVIPLPDGTRLAARLWLPADGRPVPAILEYIPYRKRDGTRGRDEPMHALVRGARLCGHPRRHARLGRIGRPPGRRIQRPGAGRRVSRSSPGSRPSPGAPAASA